MASLCFRFAVVYLIVGMFLGIYMGITGEFYYHPLHAHINLLGFVLLMVFGFYYKLYPQASEGRLAKSQFWIYNAGTIFSLLALFMVLSGNEQFEQALKLTNPLIFIGGVLFAVIVFKSSKLKINTETI